MVLFFIVLSLNACNRFRKRLLSNVLLFLIKKYFMFIKISFVKNVNRFQNPTAGIPVKVELNTQTKLPSGKTTFSGKGHLTVVYLLYRTKVFTIFLVGYWFFILFTCYDLPLCSSFYRSVISPNFKCTTLNQLEKIVLTK